MLYVLISCIVLCVINIKIQRKQLETVIIFLMIFIMSCNNNASDELNLYTDYMKFFDGTHRLYDFTTYIFSEMLERPMASLGIPFGCFNIITISFAWRLIYKALEKNQCEKNIVFLIYSSTSLLLDTTLIRQFLAFAIILHAFNCLFEQPINKVKYVLLVFLASLMHFGMIVFLTYLLAFVNPKYTRKFYIGMGVLLIVFSLINNKSIIGVDYVLRLFGGIKMSNYVNSFGSVNNGWLYTLLIWVILYKINRYIKQQSFYYVPEENYAKIAQIDNLVSISIIFVVFSMLSLVFSRLLRPVSWLVFMEIALLYKYKVHKKLTIKMETILVALMLFIYAFIYNRIIFTYKYCNEPVLNGIPFWDEDYSKLPTINY